MGDAPDIASAVKRALRPLHTWSETRLFGSRGEKIIWQEMHNAAPNDVIEALFDAGFAIVRAGGKLPTEVRVLTEEPYRVRVRAQATMQPLIAFAEQMIDERMWEDVEFKRRHLPQILARTALRVFEERLTEDLAKAIEAQKAEASQ